MTPGVEDRFEVPRVGILAGRVNAQRVPQGSHENQHSLVLPHQVGIPIGIVGGCLYPAGESVRDEYWLGTVWS